MFFHKFGTKFVPFTATNEWQTSTDVLCPSSDVAWGRKFLGFPYMYVRDPVRLWLKHLYQVEFCCFIVGFPQQGYPCTVDTFLVNIEHTIKHFTTVLRQKTAGAMIFHLLRLRLMVDLSTCQIFYSTQSNNIFRSLFLDPQTSS